LAIIVTPAAAVPEVIADCGAAEVPVAIVISGGFAEVGPRGFELQREVARIAAAHGVRILGPNCFGVINTASGLNGSLSIGLPRRGGISLLTQSGAYGMAAYSRSMDDGIGFAKIATLGNKIDLDEAELLEFLGRDPETKVIAVLLESISDGRRLFEAAAAVVMRKPVVVLKTGRHPGAQRAAASHTAALSGDVAVIYAALRQAGVHLVEDGLTLLDVAASLDRQPPLRGRKIGIITNSGGAGVELTDLLESKGLAVPALSPGLQATIASQLPPQGSAVNPIDITTDWQHFAAMYEFTVEALMTSGEVDAVVPILLQRSALMPEVSDAIIAASARARERGSLKPIHVCWVAPRAAEANRAKLQAAEMPRLAGRDCCRSCRHRLTTAPASGAYARMGANSPARGCQPRWMGDLGCCIFSAAAGGLPRGALGLSHRPRRGGNGGRQDAISCSPQSRTPQGDA